MSADTTCPAWHVDPVSADDDARLSRIMADREARTGDHQTKSGTLRRLVREEFRRLFGE